MPRTLDDLDAWARDHELRHAREIEERRLEDGRLIDAVKKHVDGATKPIGEVNAKLERLLATNDTQLEMMKETERYRGQREEQERASKQKKSDDELALAQAKLEAEKKAHEDGQAIEQLKQKNDRLKAWLGASAAVLVALIGAYFAVHK